MHGVRLTRSGSIFGCRSPFRPCGEDFPPFVKGGEPPSREPFQRVPADPESGVACGRRQNDPAGAAFAAAGHCRIPWPAPTAPFRTGPAVGSNAPVPAESSGQLPFRQEIQIQVVQGFEDRVQELRGGRGLPCLRQGLPPVPVLLPDREDRGDGVVEPRTARAPILRRPVRRLRRARTSAKTVASLAFRVGPGHGRRSPDPGSCTMPVRNGRDGRPRRRSEGPASRRDRIRPRGPLASLCPASAVGVVQALSLPHHTDPCEPAVRDGAQGPRMPVAAKPQGRVLGPADRILRQGDPGPGVDGVLQTMMGRQPTDPDPGFARAPGDGSHAGPAPQGLVVSSSPGIGCFCQQRGPNDPADAR